MTCETSGGARVWLRAPFSALFWLPKAQLAPRERAAHLGCLSVQFPPAPLSPSLSSVPQLCDHLGLVMVAAPVWAGAQLFFALCSLRVLLSPPTRVFPFPLKLKETHRCVLVPFPEVSGHLVLTHLLTCLSCTVRTLLGPSAPPPWTLLLGR